LKSRRYSTGTGRPHRSAAFSPAQDPIDGAARRHDNRSVSPPERHVRVVPNESSIVGRLERIASADEGGAVWTISVERTRGVGQQPDFARGETGKSIDVYVSAGLETSLQEGDRLEAQVTFRGDERGGRYVLVGTGARKR
jgi:hypothetical protein